jgi:hypothetical protein
MVGGSFQIIGKREKMNFFKWLFGKRSFIGVIKTSDPERLHTKNKDNAYSRNYKKYKKTFYKGELKPTIKNKKVKYWRLVKSAYFDMNDEYIPIYYKKRKKY